MIKVTLKGDVVKEFEIGTSALDVAASLGSGLLKATCACKINGHLADIRTQLNEDCKLEILTFDSVDGKRAFWHTSAHLLAQAVKHLYPKAVLATGPATENGFFYDFAVEKPFTADDLTKIEAEMKRIAKVGEQLVKTTLSPEEATKMMSEQGETLKLELIADHAAKGDVLSFYTQGDFTDLCAGPHLPTLAPIKAIKLTQCTGAYWKGDAENAQLCRVYGVTFPKQAELEAHLEMLEEAKKRDHNLIGRQLNYFTTSDYIGQGLPLMMPKGAKVLQILQRFVEDEEERRGYVLTKTPFMAKSDLYKLSGHWEHYKDGMFKLGDESSDEGVYALRPMTCPFQFMIFNNDLHSYRDLPIRYAETSTLFRNESSGEMHGLIRVRQFTISEGHLVIRPDQLKEEFAGVIDLVNYMMKTIGVENDITYQCSLHDPANIDKYVNDEASWQIAENSLREILTDLKIPYTEAIGEAAFYGPKLDIQFKNVHGKEDTLITVQIDFCLGERLNMTYVDSDGNKQHPMVIHRTSIGCYERTLAMLIEKHAGAMPLWLAPEQVRIMPISDKQADKVSEIAKTLQNEGLRVHCDYRNEKIGYKIREAQVEKIPYMLVIGEKEAEAGLVAVRDRKKGDIGTMTVSEFVEKAILEVKTKQ